MLRTLFELCVFKLFVHSFVTVECIIELFKEGNFFLRNPVYVYTYECIIFLNNL